MQHVHDQLIDRIEGRLDRQGRDAFERHISTCASCRAEWEETQSLAPIPKGSRPPLSPEYFTSILPRVRERIEHRRPLLHSVLTGKFVEELLMPLSFAIVAVVALSHISLQVPVAPGQPRRINIAPQEMAEFISSVDAASAGELASAAGFDDRLLLSRESIAPVASAWEEIDPTSLQDDLDTLGDEEAQDLITRLGKRTTL